MLKKLDALVLRQYNKLSLRKNKIQIFHTQQRLNYSFNNSKFEYEYEININQLHLLNNDTVNLYYAANDINTKMIIATNMLQSPNVFLRKFAIRQIRDITSERELQIPLINNNIINLLLQFLFEDKQDKTINYEIVWILKNLSIISDCYSYIVLDNIDKFTKMICEDNQDIFITKRLIWMFSNFMSSSSKFRDTVINQSKLLINFIYSIIESIDSSNFSKIELLDIVFSLYNLFYQSDILKTHLIQHKAFIHLPSISKCIKSQLNMSLFCESISVIHSFLITYIELKDEINEKEKYILLLKQCDLCSLVPFIYQSLESLDEYQETKANILHMYIILSYLSDEFIVSLIDNNILTSIEQMFCDLSSKMSKTFKQMYFGKIITLLSNFIGADSNELAFNNQNMITRKYNIIKYLLELLINNGDLIQEKKKAFHIFKVLLLNDNYDNTNIKTELVVYGILDYLLIIINSIDSVNKKNMKHVTSVIECFVSLLEYGKDLPKNDNFIHNFLEIKGFIEIINKLYQMELKQEKSEELIKYIEHLKEKYFNYNEIIN
jgi:hypothetical protein